MELLSNGVGPWSPQPPPAICEACHKAILDKFVFFVLERPWHSSCVSCSECGASLESKCFSRNGKLFCRDDFFRRFGTKCAGCHHNIGPHELVRRARNKVFHVNCFTCTACQRLLDTGEELYIVEENKFLCKLDYSASLAPSPIKMCPEESLPRQPQLPPTPEEPTSDNLPTPPQLPVKQEEVSEQEVFTELEARPAILPTSDSIPEDPYESDGEMEKSVCSPAGSNLSDDEDAETKEAIEKENSNSGSEEKDGGVSATNTAGSKRRGPRTTIKAKQLDMLKAAFASTPKPTRHIREQLAQETGLPMRVIQVWFQNRRSKERRLKQLASMGNHRRVYFRGAGGRRMRKEEEEMAASHGIPYFPDGQPHPEFFGFPPGVGGFEQYYGESERGIPPPGYMGPHDPTQMRGGASALYGQLSEMRGSPESGYGYPPPGEMAPLPGDAW